MLSKTFAALFASFSMLSLPAIASSSSCGEASYYGHGDGYAWRTMANGQPMNPSKLITAHRYLPFGTRLKVVNTSNGKEIIVTVTDRGPFISGRILDLSYGAFGHIESPAKGTATVCFSLLPS